MGEVKLKAKFTRHETIKKEEMIHRDIRRHVENRKENISEWET